MSDSITLQQVFYSSIPRRGWDAFAWTPEFDQRTIVDGHCRYAWPPVPDTRLFVDYGFRFVSERFACLWRTTRPSGTDEYNRTIHFCHSLFIEVPELDRIDCDVPALFAWVEARDLFISRTSDAVEKYESAGYRLEPLVVGTDELREWRHRRDQCSPSEWLSSWPHDEREDVIRTALRLALAPGSGPSNRRRSAVWLDSSAENPVGGRLYEVMCYLFSVLPFAYRRRLTFSSYRHVSDLKEHAGLQWIGSALFEGDRIDEETRRYTYHVVPAGRPLIPKTLPETGNPWAERIRKEGDMPLSHSATGTVVRFGHAFAAADDAELYDVSGAFLDSIHKASGLFHTGRGSCSALLPFVRKRMRADNAELLDGLSRALVPTEVGKIPWWSDQLKEIAAIWRQLVQGVDGEALSEPERVERLIEGCIEFLSQAVRVDAWDEAATMLTALRKNTRLNAVRSRVVPKIVEQLIGQIGEGADCARYQRMAGLLSPYFADSPSNDPEWVEFRDLVRNLLCSRPGEFAKLFAATAEQDVAPYLCGHVPQAVSEIASVLELSAQIKRRGGPALGARYLVDVFRRLPIRRFSFSRQEDLAAMLRDYPDWQEAAAQLPPDFGERLRELGHSDLWATVWFDADVPKPDRYYRNLCTLLDSAEDDAADVAAFADRYAASGGKLLIVSIGDALTRRRAPSRDEFVAHVRIIGRSSGFLSDHRKELTARHLSRLLQWVAATLGEDTDQRLLESLAAAEPLLKHRKWSAIDWLKWLGELGRVAVIERSMGGRATPPNATLLAAWKQAFPGDDPLVPVLAAECVCVTPAHDLSREKVLLTAMVGALMQSPRMEVPRTTPLLDHICEMIGRATILKAQVRARIVNELRMHPLESSRIWLGEAASGAVVLDLVTETGVWEDVISPAIQDVNWTSLLDLHRVAATGRFPQFDDHVRERVESALKRIVDEDPEVEIPSGNDRFTHAVRLVSGSETLAKFIRKCVRFAVSRYERNAEAGSDNMNRLALFIEECGRQPEFDGASFFSLCEERNLARLVVYEFCDAGRARCETLLDYLRSFDTNDKLLRAFCSELPQDDLKREDELYRRATVTWRLWNNSSRRYLSAFLRGIGKGGDERPMHAWEHVDKKEIIERAERRVRDLAIVTCALMTTHSAGRPPDVMHRLEFIASPEVWAKTCESCRLHAHWKIFEDEVRSQLRNARKQFEKQFHSREMPSESVVLSRLKPPSPAQEPGSKWWKWPFGLFSGSGSSSENSPRKPDESS